jgi:hypothetical protein
MAVVTRRRRPRGEDAGSPDRNELSDRIRLARSREERRAIQATAIGLLSFRQAFTLFRHRPRFDRWAIARVVLGTSGYPRVRHYDVDTEHPAVQVFPSRRLAKAEACRRNKHQALPDGERWEAAPVPPEPTTFPDEVRLIWRETFGN